CAVARVLKLPGNPLCPSLIGLRVADKEVGSHLFLSRPFPGMPTAHHSLSLFPRRPIGCSENPTWVVSFATLAEALPGRPEDDCSPPARSAASAADAGSR